MLTLNLMFSILVSVLPPRWAERGLIHSDGHSAWRGFDKFVGDSHFLCPAFARKRREPWLPG